MGYASFLAFSSTFLGLVSHRKEAASFRLDNLLQHPERNRPGDPSISHVTAILPSLLGRIRSIATHDKAELRPQLCTRPTIALHPAAQLEPCHCSRPCHPLTATCAVCCRGPQCSHCISRWTSTSAKPSCPLCRSAMERPTIPAAISHIAIPPAASASAPRWPASRRPQRDGGRAARSVQYRLEAEHAQREEAHRRRVDFERRAQVPSLSLARTPLDACKMLTPGYPDACLTVDCRLPAGLYGVYAFGAAVRQPSGDLPQRCQGAVYGEQDQPLWRDPQLLRCRSRPMRWPLASYGKASRTTATTTHELWCRSSRIPPHRRSHKTSDLYAPSASACPARSPQLSSKRAIGTTCACDSHE